MVFQTDWKTDKASLVFQNITIDSNGETIVANGSNFGLFAQYTNYNISGVKFIDCENKASINNSGTSTGVFLGSGWMFDQGAKEKIEFINCKNSGNITGTYNTGILYGNSAYVGLYVGNEKVQKEYDNNNFVINNVENTGNIISIMSNGIIGVAPGSKLFDQNVINKGSCLAGAYFSGKTIKVDLSDANNFKFSFDSHNEGLTYKIAFNIGTITNKDGTKSNTTKYFYNATLSNDVTVAKLSQKYVAMSEEVAKQNNVSAKSFDNNGIAMVVQNDKTVLVFDKAHLADKTIGENSSGQSNVSVLLYAYDKDGYCIGVINIK